METLSQFLAVAAGTTAVGTLAIIFTMKECSIATVRAVLLFKVWAVGLLFAVPAALLAAAVRMP